MGYPERPFLTVDFYQVTLYQGTLRLRSGQALEHPAVIAGELPMIQPAFDKQPFGCWLYPIYGLLEQVPCFPRVIAHLRGKDFSPLGLAVEASKYRG